MRGEVGLRDGEQVFHVAPPGERGQHAVLPVGRQGVEHRDPPGHRRPFEDGNRVENARVQLVARVGAERVDQERDRVLARPLQLLLREHLFLVGLAEVGDELADPRLSVERLADRERRLPVQLLDVVADLLLGGRVVGVFGHGAERLEDGGAVLLFELEEVGFGRAALEEVVEEDAGDVVLALVHGLAELGVVFQRLERRPFGLRGGAAVEHETDGESEGEERSGSHRVVSSVRPGERVEWRNRPRTFHPNGRYGRGKANNLS